MNFLLRRAKILYGGVLIIDGDDLITMRLYGPSNGGRGLKTAELKRVLSGEFRPQEKYLRRVIDPQQQGDE